MEDVGNEACFPEVGRQKVEARTGENGALDKASSWRTQVTSALSRARGQREQRRRKRETANRAPLWGMPYWVRY